MISRRALVCRMPRMWLCHAWRTSRRKTQPLLNSAVEFCLLIGQMLLMNSLYPIKIIIIYLIFIVAIVTAARGVKAPSWTLNFTRRVSQYNSFPIFCVFKTSLSHWYRCFSVRILTAELRFRPCVKSHLEFPEVTRKLNFTRAKPCEGFLPQALSHTVVKTFILPHTLFGRRWRSPEPLSVLMSAGGDAILSTTGPWGTMRGNNISRKQEVAQFVCQKTLNSFITPVVLKCRC